jgi:hypothetical protein
MNKITSTEFTPVLTPSSSVTPVVVVETTPPVAEGVIEKVIPDNAVVTHAGHTSKWLLVAVPPKPVEWHPYENHISRAEVRPVSEMGLLDYAHRLRKGFDHDADGSHTTSTRFNDRTRDEQPPLF